MSWSSASGSDPSPSQCPGLGFRPCPDPGDGPGRGPGLSQFTRTGSFQGPLRAL